MIHVQTKATYLLSGAETSDTNWQWDLESSKVIEVRGKRACLLANTHTSDLSSAVGVCNRKDVAVSSGF